MARPLAHLLWLRSTVQMVFISLEHAQRRNAPGSFMSLGEPIHIALDGAERYAFMLNRVPVTCTTVIMKECDAPTSFACYGYGEEDYRDVRDRLVELGLYRDIMLCNLNPDDKHGRGSCRRAEETLRRFARDGIHGASILSVFLVNGI
jgi:hypothetical protein